MASRIRAGGVFGAPEINPDTTTWVSTTQPLGVLNLSHHFQRRRVSAAAGAIQPTVLYEIAVSPRPPAPLPRV